MLALAVGSASAGRLSTSSQTFSIVWTSLELANNFGIGNTVRCPVTLEGSFHSRSITKVERTLIGFVTRATVANELCRGGHATVHNETLPWHVTYERFTGTLPNITSVTLLLRGIVFDINNEAATCTSTGRDNAAGIASLSGGRVTTMRADESRLISLTGGLCSFARGFFIGEGTVSVLGSGSPITLTLI
jgi:hypothetical protein